MPRYNPILETLRTYPQQALEQKKAEICAKGKKLYDFGIGDPTEPVPNFIRQGLKDALPPNCRYPTVKGEQHVRQAMAGYIERRFGITLDIEKNILPLSGAKEAVFHIPHLVIDPTAEDRTIVFPDPGYPVCYRGALFAGADPYPVPLSGDYIFRPWTLPVDVLKKTRLLWINSPHNPSGAVMSLADLQKTADICRKYDILLVSDECYADIYHQEPPHSILECGLDNVLALFSLSKRSGMTGYRSGFVAGDPEVIAKFYRYRANPGVVPQSFVNEAAALAWEEDQHVAERREIFARKKALFLAFFDRVQWKTIGREASLYLWIQVPENSTSQEWALRLVERGVVVSTGAMFALTEAGKGYLRIAMVPSEEECQETIAIWERLIIENKEK